MHQGDADALRHLVTHNNPKSILENYCSLVYTQDIQKEMQAGGQLLSYDTQILFVYF